jgi:DNA-binding NtrC family response regulator/nitrogen-specific signal transduction histidine kinase
MAVFDKNRLKKEKDKTAQKHTIMIVDDEKNHLESMENLLSENFHIITASDGLEALGIINKIEHPEEISLVISDQRMPGLNGIQLLEKLKDIIPNTLRIILTGYDDKDVMMTAINEINIYQFIMKPFDPDELKLRLIRAVEAFERQQELDAYRNNLEETFFSEGPKHPDHFKDIITKSQKMENIFKYIEAIAEFNSPVLITGETGSGKELIARAIHKISRRQKGNFVPANISGFDDQLFSDTLFGHEKGAFTDAKSRRSGLIERAKGGTFFLDEIGDIQMPSQIKLLRLIQENEYYRIGSDKAVYTDARFILATNKDINALKETGEFRKGLFFRLNTHHIHLPPLREHKEDILPLVDYFVKKAAEEYNKKIPLTPDKLIALLSHYHFPGNIRELRGMVFEAVSLHQPSEQELSLDVFIKKIKEQDGEINFSEAKKSEIIFGEPLPTFEEMKDSETRRATFINIPPGKYTFMVKGSNSDGIWDDNTTSIKITILSPWWKTWWAYALYFLAFIGLAYLIWSAWSKRFLKQKVEERTNELKNTQSQLVQSEKMASLGFLVAGVAHEINNPSSFAHTSAYNLEKDLEKLKAFLIELAGDDVDKEILNAFDEKFNVLFNHLASIKEGTSRISKTVSDLRTFSHIEKEEMKPIKILEGLQITLNLVKTQYKDKVDFVTDFQSDSEVEGIVAELNQVFMNLLVNACHAILEKQKITGKEITGTLTIKTIEEKEHAVIRFQDTGVGMSEEVKQKMFDPFFTTRTVGEGIVLGLFISYEIIRKHKGRFQVESMEDKGTTVAIYLPLTEKRNI